MAKIAKIVEENQISNDQEHFAQVDGNSSQSRMRLLFRGIIFGLAVTLSHVSLIFIVIIAVDVIISRRPLRVSGHLLWMLPSLLLVGIIEIASASFVPTGLLGIPSAIVGISIILYSLLVGSNIDHHAEYMLTGFILPVLLANFTSFLLGVQASGAYLSSSESWMGGLIGVERRVFFYFSDGINAYGTLLGLILLVSVFLFVRYRSVLLLSSVVISFLSVMLSDSRGAVASGAILAFVAFFRRRLDFLVPLLIASICGPLVLYVFSDELNRLFADFSRVGDDITSGRLFYWSQILNAVLSNPWLMLFGAGINGTSTLPLNIEAVPAFSNYVMVDGIFPGAHNMWLQLLVDGGVLKVCIYFVILFIVFRRASSRSHTNLYIASIGYIPVAGMFESILDYNRFEVLFILFFIAGCILHPRYSVSRDSKAYVLGEDGV